MSKTGRQVKARGEVPYHDMKPVEFDLLPRQSTKYKRPKMSSQRFVPEMY